MRAVNTLDPRYIDPPEWARQMRQAVAEGWIPKNRASDWLVTDWLIASDYAEEKGLEVLARYLRGVGESLRLLPECATEQLRR